MEELIEALKDQTAAVNALIAKIDQLICGDDGEEVPHPSKYLDGSSG